MNTMLQCHVLLMICFAFIMVAQAVFENRDSRLFTTRFVHDSRPWRRRCSETKCRLIYDIKTTLEAPHPSLEGRCMKVDVVATKHTKVINKYIGFCRNVYCPLADKEKTYCFFRQAICNFGEWGSWSTSKDKDRLGCYLEKRLRGPVYTYRTTGILGSCDQIKHVQCDGVFQETRKKVVHCQSLSPPKYGTLKSHVCSAKNSSCSAICQMGCKDGFNIQGNSYVSCNADGNWDRTFGTCRDILPPVITCPNVTFFGTLPSKTYSMIDIPIATATDNSGLMPTVTASHTSPLQVDYGSPVDVIYTATDETGNTVTCKIQLIVKDTDPPRIVSCPTDFTVTPAKFPSPVVWNEPVFQDNIDGDHVILNPNYYNGQNFPEGKFVVRITATDSSNNNSTCEFTLQVAKAFCPVWNHPYQGAKACNIHHNGKNETYVCSVSCRKGYNFPVMAKLPKVYNYYFCGPHGNWQGQDLFKPNNPFFTSIPRNQRPWPDCSKVSSAGNYTSHPSFGNCKDPVEVEKIKQAFVTAMKKDVLLNTLYCTKTSKDQCVTSNVVVTCDKDNKAHISFKLENSSAGSGLKKVARFRSHVSVSVEEHAKNKIQEIIASLSFGHQPHAINSKCPAGSVLMSTKQCLDCPIGMYHDGGQRKCVECPIAYYQDNEGSLTCVECPQYHSTIEEGSRNATDCKEICHPGSSSPTGLATCLACKRGSYQPRFGQLDCIKCPVGTTTKKDGSGLLSDCHS